MTSCGSTYRVIPGPTFVRQTKDLLKRFPCLKSTLIEYFTVLEQSGAQGKCIPRFPVLWKDRLPIPSRKIGKSGGLRIISYFDAAALVIRPLLIYHKADMPEPPDQLYKRVLNELAA